VTLSGGGDMRKLEATTCALTGAILAIVPVAALQRSWAFRFGNLGLIVLLDSQVKAAFEVSNAKCHYLKLFNISSHPLHRNCKPAAQTRSQCHIMGA